MRIVASVLADPMYETLKEYILQRTALHYYSERDEDFATRIGRRIAARELRNCAAYLQLLRSDVGQGSEWDALVGEITIGETYFFRQSEHFDLLRTTIIPDTLRRNASSRTLRIWSAGCATGAEPYSISLVLHRDFHDQLQNWDVNILATDINVQFLAQARTGRFGEWALRHLPDTIRQCCFRRTGPMWELLPEYRRFVDFRQLNLATDGLFPGIGSASLDVIMCRNVMIYFSEEKVRRMAQSFHDSLAPGGWLLVGHAEPSYINFPQFEVFAGNGTTAYRKSASVMAPTPWQPVTAWPLLPGYQATKTTPPTSTARRQVPAAAAEFVPRALAPSIQSRIDAALVFADQGDWDNAGKVCRQVIEQTPLNVAGHFILGLVAEHTGDPALAEASFRKAIYLDREFALAHYHLGLILHKTGNIPLARKSFQNTIESLRLVSPDELLPHGDGMRASELRELAEMHLEMNG